MAVWAVGNLRRNCQHSPEEHSLKVEKQIQEMEKVMVSLFIPPCYALRVPEKHSHDSLQPGHGEERRSMSQPSTPKCP
jgi:hypothetical protein